MRIENIERALISALSLLESEVDSIEFDELRNDYLVVIEQIEVALKAISKDE